MNLDEREAIARAATPGPWSTVVTDLSYSRRRVALCETDGGDGADVWSSTKRMSAEADAAHIAANDPQTVLSDLARMRELEGSLADSKRDADRANKHARLAVDWPVIQKRAEKAEAKVATLTEALRAMEWVVPSDAPGCPCCGNGKEADHAGGCLISIALHESKEPA